MPVVRYKRGQVQYLLSSLRATAHIRMCAPLGHERQIPRKILKALK